MSFPRYPSYKASGVEWLREVPAHWTIASLGRRYEVALGKMLDEKRITGHYLAPYLKNSDVQWDVVNTNDLREMDFDDADRVRYSLRWGDLLVCEGGEVGRCAVWQAPIADCYYQKALHRLRPHVEARDTARFLRFVLRAAADTGAFAADESSATIAHLPAEALRRYRFAFPSANEQSDIASFLDRETAKLDALVAEQVRLIELLKEKRQAVISHAVTKGLNPDAPMKPSGIEWLGNVPAHWRIARLAHYATVENGSTPNRERLDFWEDGAIPWVASGEVNQDRITEASALITKLALASCSVRLLPKGSIVVGLVGQGKTRGMAARLEIDATINQNLGAIVPGPELESDYVLFMFQAMYEYLREFGRGGNQAALNCEILSALRVPIPPHPEQHGIATYIGKQLARFDALTTDAERAVALLQERRSALISAAVTGQIDVRSLAQRAS